MRRLEDNDEQDQVFAAKELTVLRKERMSLTWKGLKYHVISVTGGQKIIRFLLSAFSAVESE